MRLFPPPASATKMPDRPQGVVEADEFRKVQNVHNFVSVSREPLPRGVTNGILTGWELELKKGYSTHCGV